MLSSWKTITNVGSWSGTTLQTSANPDEQTQWGLVYSRELLQKIFQHYFSKFPTNKELEDLYQNQPRLKNRVTTQSSYTIVGIVGSTVLKTATRPDERTQWGCFYSKDQFREIFSYYFKRPPNDLELEALYLYQPGFKH